MFKNKLLLLAVVTPILLAAGLRLYQLGVIPAGMTWDEAAIGYNGYGIVSVHRDEWLNRTPLSFRSFGDYKAPAAIYLNGLFTAVFGLNLFAIRLPFALAGILTVALAMWWSRLVWDKEWRQLSGDTQCVFLWNVGLLVAVSPWLHHFSRAGFESGLTLSLMLIGLTGVWLLSRFKGWQRWALLLISLSFFILAMYTYHSAKLVIPLLAITLVIYFRKHVRKNWQMFSIGVGWCLLLLVPLLWVSFQGQGNERLNQVSIFSDRSVSEGVLLMSQNFFRHLQPSFLIFGETTSLRHGDGRWGVLTSIELGLILISLWHAINQPKYRKPILLGLSLIVIGLLPASIGKLDEIPHANRALLAYPGFLILFSGGVMTIMQWYRSLQHQGESLKLWYSQITVGMLTMLIGLVALAYLNDYFHRFAALSPEAYNYGYQEAFDYILEQEDEVDKILMTSKYGQPYIYALLAKQATPIEFHQGILFKYEFKDEINIGDFVRPNTLLVATPQEIDPSVADKLIIAPNGEVRFVIVKTKDE